MAFMSNSFGHGSRKSAPLKIGRVLARQAGQGRPPAPAGQGLADDRGPGGLPARWRIARVGLPARAQNGRSPGVVFQSPLFSGPGLPRLSGNRVLGAVDEGCGAQTLAPFGAFPSVPPVGGTAPPLELSRADHPRQPDGCGRGLPIYKMEHFELALVPAADRGRP